MHGAASTAIELFHGYTYSAHPLAVRGGARDARTYKEEGLFERAARAGAVLGGGVHALRGRPHVIDIRNIGLMGGDRAERAPGKPGERAYDAMLKGCDKGIMLRITADTIAMSPPLIVTRAQIDEIVAIVGQVLDELD